MALHAAGASKSPRAARRALSKAVSSSRASQLDALRPGGQKLCAPPPLLVPPGFRRPASGAAVVGCIEDPARHSAASLLSCLGVHPCCLPPSAPAARPQVNQKNVHGQTPLMLACRAGAADCVRLLLEAGADATLFDDLQQRTCLHYAGGGWWLLLAVGYSRARSESLAAPALSRDGRPPSRGADAAPHLPARNGSSELRPDPGARHKPDVRLRAFAPAALCPARVPQPCTAGQRQSTRFWRTSLCCGLVREGGGSSSSRRRG